MPDDLPVAKRRSLWIPPSGCYTEDEPDCSKLSVRLPTCCLLRSHRPRRVETRRPRLPSQGNQIPTIMGSLPPRVRQRDVYSWHQWSCPSLEGRHRHFTRGQSFVDREGSISTTALIAKMSALLASESEPHISVVSCLAIASTARSQHGSKDCGEFIVESLCH